MTTLIEGGTVVTATDMTQADVLIDGERIQAIGQGLGGWAKEGGRGTDRAADTVIDATGRYVMPGGIDVHTHMELPFGGTFASDDFATGTAAAAWGGTTTIVDFAVQGYGESLAQGLDTWLAKAEPKSHIDFGLHLIVREINEGILREMDTMIDRGVPSFKLFMAYPGVFMLDDASIFRAMSRTADNGGLIMLHAENGGAIDVLVQRYLAEGKTSPVNHGLTRPSSMEGEATHRAIALAELAGVPVYIVHLSSREALTAVREGRDRGVPAYAETCPQYLYLSLDDLARPGFEGAKFVCSPPLRTADHQADLWRGLVISPTRFVELIATAPARMFGLHPRKGTLASGADADIVVFNPHVERTLSASTHHMRVDYSCYEGRKVRGLPEVVMQRGNVLVRDGKFLGKQGAGRFLQRSRFGPGG
jgi:dihydropyrimidinase